MPRWPYLILAVAAMPAEAAKRLPPPAVRVGTVVRAPEGTRYEVVALGRDGVAVIRCAGSGGTGRVESKVVAWWLEKFPQGCR